MENQGGVGNCENQFSSSPRSSHWDAVVRILKYLMGAPRHG